MKIYKKENDDDIDYEIIPNKGNRWRAWLTVEKDKTKKSFIGFVRKGKWFRMGACHISQRTVGALVPLFEKWCMVWDDDKEEWRQNDG